MTRRRARDPPPMRSSTHCQRVRCGSSSGQAGSALSGRGATATEARRWYDSGPPDAGGTATRASVHGARAADGRWLGRRADRHRIRRRARAAAAVGCRCRWRRPRPGDRAAPDGGSSRHGSGRPRPGPRWRPGGRRGSGSRPARPGGRGRCTGGTRSSATSGTSGRSCRAAAPEHRSPGTARSIFTSASGRRGDAAARVGGVDHRVEDGVAGVGRRAGQVAVGLARRWRRRARHGWRRPGSGPGPRAARGRSAARPPGGRARRRPGPPSRSRWSRPTRSWRTGWPRRRTRLRSGRGRRASWRRRPRPTRRPTQRAPARRAGPGGASASGPDPRRRRPGDRRPGRRRHRRWRRTGCRRRPEAVGVGSAVRAADSRAGRDRGSAGQTAPQP